MRRGAVAALMLLCSCAVPARSFAAYEHKAADAAASAASASNTAILVVRAVEASNVTAASASVLLGEAEMDAVSTQGLFRSLQPPDARSEALRAQLAAVLERAVDVLGELRIAARGGALSRLPVIARPLNAIAQILVRFSKEHG